MSIILIQENLEMEESGSNFAFVKCLTVKTKNYE